jgi:xanthine dehydrogenase molybdopterin-binding subunit B
MAAGAAARTLHERLVEFAASRYRCAKDAVAIAEKTATRDIVAAASLSRMRRDLEELYGRAVA